LTRLHVLTGPTTLPLYGMGTGEWRQAG